MYATTLIQTGTRMSLVQIASPYTLVTHLIILIRRRLPDYIHFDSILNGSQNVKFSEQVFDNNLNNTIRGLYSFTFELNDFSTFIDQNSYNQLF